MKLLIVINNLATGGAEKLLVDSIPLFDKAGIDVHLLLLNGTKHPFYLALEEKDCCSISDLGTGSLYNPLLAFKMRKYLKSADIVHAHIFPTLYWLAIAKLFSNNKAKFVYTEHSINNRRRSFFWKWIDRFMYLKFDKIITIAETVEVALKAHIGLDDSRYTIIKNGIDLKAIQRAKPIELPFFSVSEAKVLLQVSRFYFPKDQETLIKALQYVPDNVCLLLVGEGDDKVACETLVENLNLKERVKFLGIRTDVPALLKTADMIVLSSGFEGLSLSSIEGMASGNPFIASDVPGLTEVVKGAGVLFTAGDEKELASVINNLIENPLETHAVSERCMQRASEYAIETMVDQHIKLYKTLC